MSIYDEIEPKSDQLDGAWIAKFATPVPHFQIDPAFVIIDSFSDEHKIGPMPWSPAEQASGATPTLGDKCLVLYDENENPYIVAWWPSGSFSL